MSINRVLISGHLTRDAELRHTQTGLPIASFCIAVNDRRKNPQTGEWENYPNFIDVSFFGTRAEKCMNMLTKGAKVFIDGKLRYSSWENDGQKRSKLDVAVDNIEFTKKQEQPQQDYYSADMPF